MKKITGAKPRRLTAGAVLSRPNTVILQPKADSLLSAKPLTPPPRLAQALTKMYMRHISGFPILPTIMMKMTELH